MKKITIGEPAPDFELPDQDGVNHKLSDYLGKWILIYFYPKDDTPGCTKEACTIAEAWPDFKKLKVQVFGISIDSVEKHKKFSEKYDLPFTLLSDEGKKVVSKYGVFGKKKFMGKEYMGTFRTSFLINPKGLVEKIYENVKPELHAEEVLTDLKSLRNS